MIDPEIEALARALLKEAGTDPDILVQPGDPHIYGTPNGRAFMIMPEAGTPLWRLYIPMARQALDAARRVIAQSQVMPESLVIPAGANGAAPMAAE